MPAKPKKKKPSYDEALAERSRKVLAGERGVTEKKMFGGVCFLHRGNMVGGVADGILLVRVGADAYEAALAEPHVRPMTFTGRPLKGMVYVDPRGCATAAALARWLRKGLAFASSLPPK